MYSRDDNMKVRYLPELEKRIGAMAIDSDSQISDLVDLIIKEGISHGASDIYFEPLENKLLIRFRIDGVLLDICALSTSLLPRIIARLKIMAGLVVYQKDIPQDGHIKITAGSGHEENKEGENDVELRVATFPTIHGEKVIVRIFNARDVLFELGQLGFDPQILKNFTKLILQPQGTIFLTGPSSSGKTTTIYAALKKIMQARQRNSHIVTIEDPVEYNLKEISQTQVAPHLGLTFEKALRSILRQDPEVIMIGEVRDVETVKIAVQAGLTGHLVITTIHSGTACGVFARLIEMGIEPFLITSSVTGILAQRLVKLICPDCRSSYQPDKEILADLGMKPDNDFTFTRGEGCSQCAYTGYKGRTVIAELLLINNEVARVIHKKQDTPDLEEIARNSGMIDFKKDGLKKVYQGLTTPEELCRVISYSGRYKY